MILLLLVPFSVKADTLEDAKKAYNSGKYEEAVRLYQTAAEQSDPKTDRSVLRCRLMRRVGPPTAFQPPKEALSDEAQSLGWAGGPAPDADGNLRALCVLCGQFLPPLCPNPLTIPGNRCIIQ